MKLNNPSRSALMMMMVLLSLLSGWQASPACHGAENVPALKKRGIEEEAAKPAFEKKLGGVRFTAFHAAEKAATGRGSERAWMTASNSRKEPMIVCGIVSHSFQARLDGLPATESVTMTISEKFAQVVGSGKQEVVWMRDRSNLVGLPITLDDGRVCRVVEVLGVHVADVLNLEVK